MLIVFSGFGYGIAVFDALTDAYDWTGLFVPATGLLLTTTYLFDYNYWDTNKRWVHNLKAFVTVLILVMLGVCAALSSRKYPPAPTRVCCVASSRLVFPGSGV